MHSTTLIGVYAPGGDPYCTRCAPAEGTRDGSTWSAIFPDTEGDTPTHCTECEDLIPHALTSDGYDYVAEHLSDHRADPTAGRAVILDQWREQYGAGLGA